VLVSECNVCATPLHVAAARPVRNSKRYRVSWQPPQQSPNCQCEWQRCLASRLCRDALLQLGVAKLKLAFSPRRSSLRTRPRGGSTSSWRIVSHSGMARCEDGSGRHVSRMVRNGNSSDQWLPETLVPASLPPHMLSLSRPSGTCGERAWGARGGASGFRHFAGRALTKTAASPRVL
jgi:hypothetical protein